MKRRQLINQTSYYLDESNLLGVAAEALPAAHEPVLTDQAMGIAADTAVKEIENLFVKYGEQRIQQMEPDENKSFG